MEQRPEIIINLGGEGELTQVLGEMVINVNVRHITDKDFVAARDGTTTLPDILASGQHIVIARGDQLPFFDGVADRVIAQSAPVGDFDTWLGPAHRPSEIKRIQRPTFPPIK